MLNQLVMVGRLVDDPELRQISEENQATYIKIAVPRSFKNADGEYETDFFDCVIWNSIVNATNEYCHKGDLIGIKGRLQNKKYEDVDGNIKNYNEIVAEKVTFLQSTNKNSG